MELSDRVAVVTGGASGIGRAMAGRFIAEGARGVMIADINATLAEKVAAELGEPAMGSGCDVSVEDELGAVISQAQDVFGDIDLFCANAGIASGQGVDAPDEVWERMLAVNLHAHVLAARRLLPGWLERGEGYFLTTASAAGLVTQIGDAPYAVTKHAAVAFAEWLAVTYGGRGVRVSCLCPMGVDTPLVRTGLDAGGEQGLGARVVAAAGELLAPERVAADVVDALREERFLILPHPEVLEFLRRKSSDYDRWIAGMQRLQAHVAGPAQ